MPKKKATRVELIADNRTVGAKAGDTARPLEKDAEAWLAKGWQRVEQEDTAQEAE